MPILYIFQLRKHSVRQYIVCPNYYGQYFNDNGISLYVYCVLTLIAAEQFNRTPFR